MRSNLKGTMMVRDNFKGTCISTKVLNTALHYQIVLAE